MKCIAALLAFALSASVSGARDDRAKLSDLAEQALRQSQLTLPGSRPFHLQASLRETTNPKSDYQATIEEFWISPAKWRRTITSPGFSQTLIVNGDQVSEINTGDYFPWWLDEFVTAIFNPLPMLDLIKASDTVLQKPAQGAPSQNCGGIRSRTNFWNFCFSGSHELLASVITRGYGMEFSDYKKFADKHVARTIDSDPEPGTHLQARITELTEFTQSDDQLFAFSEPTPPEQRIRTVRLDEDVVRKIAINSTEIDWPTVGEGLTTGGCAVYISADRQGQVREVWPEGCDNAGLQDPLREIVRKWKLKPAVANGLPVQVNSLVTFTFHTGQEKSKALPQLSDVEVRKLAFYTVDPVFPSGTASKLKEVSLNISVDETGKLAGGGPAIQMPNDVFVAAYDAVIQWRFHPYVLNGKPQYFHGTLTFPVR